MRRALHGDVVAEQEFVERVQVARVRDGNHGTIEFAHEGQEAREFAAPAGEEVAERLPLWDFVGELGSHVSFKLRACKAHGLACVAADVPGAESPSWVYR